MIYVAHTPRTGSNLLTTALATHPEIKDGGEWDGESYTRFSPTSNLYKVDYRTPLRLDSEDVLIYLYRENTTRQLLSWQKALATGYFTANEKETNLERFEFAPQDIAKAHNRFLPISHIVISYEVLVGYWDSCIYRILNAAKLTPIKMRPILRKQL